MSLLMLMESKRSWFVVLMIFSFFLSSYSQSLNSLSHDSLDDLLQDYAFKALARPHHTGALYKVALPANISGMEASIVRLRSGSFWTRGANFTAFRIPPRVKPVPYVKRLAIVYQNLGNWSSSYYNVPGYLLVTPVIGFMAYNASNVSAEEIRKLNVNATGDPITIYFPKFTLPEGSNSKLSCVRFGAGGSMDFSEINLPNVCFTRDQGHYAIVIPSPPKNVKKKRRERLWKLLVIGFAFGFVGLVVLGLFGLLVFKFVKMKKIGKMERQADEGEAFDTIWIGNSKMPSATVIRTQPVLENEEAP